jgi:hypothetical protein
MDDESGNRRVRAARHAKTVHLGLMRPARRKVVRLTKPDGRRVWLRAQGLDLPAPFGDGAEATTAAVEHLGYVQIDTINVIERSHHHILWTRIPT